MSTTIEQQKSQYKLNNLDPKPTVGKLIFLFSTSRTALFPLNLLCNGYLGYFLEVMQSRHSMDHPITPSTNIKNGRALYSPLRALMAHYRVHFTFTLEEFKQMLTFYKIVLH
jgi:hypothetical protein